MKILKSSFVLLLFFLSFQIVLGKNIELTSFQILTDTLPNPKNEDVLIRELPLGADKKVALPAETRAIFPMDTSVRLGKMENGLNYYVKHLPSGNRKWAKCYLVVKAGFAMEADDQIGAATAVKHLVLKETEDMMEPFVRFEHTGLSGDDDYEDVIKTFSGFEETIFEYSTPILEIAQLSSALSVLKTWASEAVLDPAWIEKERLNVIKNSPRLYGISTILQNKTVFAGTRYGDRIPADISAKLKELKPGAIKKFYNEWYRPDLMAVVIVGNNDVDITEQELIKVFSEIKKPVSKVPDTSANYVDGQILKTDIMANAQFTDSEVRILFQNQKRPVRDQFGYRQLIMNELINVMFQERFKTAEFKLSGVRKPGFLRPSGNTEFLFVNLFCSEGKVIEYLKPALIEIDRLRKIGFTEAELEKAKIYIGQKHSSEKDLTDDHQIDAMSEKMIWHYLDGEPLLDVHTQEEILKNYLPKIKLNEINKKFAQLTKEENCCILIKGNSGSIGTLSDASQIKKLIEEVRIK